MKNKLNIYFFIFVLAQEICISNCCRKGNERRQMKQAPITATIASFFNHQLFYLDKN